MRTLNTAIVKIDEAHTGIRGEEYIAEAARILRAGGLVVFPTETVYGLGADAYNTEAAKKIYEAKGRPSDNPLIVHIADVTALDTLCVFDSGAVRARAMRLADAFWPGPLTMILRKDAALPAQTTGGLDTVAVRMPANETARRLIREAGGFVAAPSANRSGRPSPTLARYCIEDMDGRVDMIIDGGASRIGLESSIVDLTAEQPVMLRPGIVTAGMVAEALSENVSDGAGKEDTNGAPKAPGMKYRHYAPRGKMTVVDGNDKDMAFYINEAVDRVRREGKKTGVIASAETVSAYRADIIKSAGSRKDGTEIAHSLFRLLREMDDEGAEIIFSESFRTCAAADAIMNRLYKAAGGHIVFATETS